MRLTTKSEYALLALIYVSRHDDALVRVDTMCAEYGLSKKYLENLLTILKNQRYLKTKRGTGGGYALARAASTITVAEIIRLMDGPLAPIESASHYFFSHTPLEKEKKIMKVMKEIRNFIAHRLEKLTIADLT